MATRSRRITRPRATYTVDDALIDAVDPIDRRVTYRRVKAREVLGIWRKSRAQTGRCTDLARAVG